MQGDFNLRILHNARRHLLLCDDNFSFSNYFLSVAGCGLFIVIIILFSVLPLFFMRQEHFMVICGLLIMCLKLRKNPSISTQRRRSRLNRNKMVIIYLLGQVMNDTE